MLNILCIPEAYIERIFIVCYCISNYWSIPEAFLVITNLCQSSVTELISQSYWWKARLTDRGSANFVSVVRLEVHLKMIGAPLLPNICQGALFWKAKRKLTWGIVSGRFPSGIYLYICQIHLDPHLSQFVDQDCGSR